MGEDRSISRWLILAHVVNHGTQHRSELARYLTDCVVFLVVTGYKG